MAKYLSKLVIQKVGITSVKSCHISQFEDNQIAMMIQQDIVSKHNPGYTFPRYGKLQLMKAPRENYPQAPEVSPLNLSSVSKIQCRGNDGGANLIKFLESHFNSLDVSAMVGPQAYKELKSYVQDGFNRIDEILPSIADFVDISNLKTATEAANMFKKAFKYNMAAAVKIATRAAVRNVIDTIEDMQGPLHPWGDPSAMGYHTPTNYSTHATEYENIVEQPTDTRHCDHKFGASQCTPTKFNGAPGSKETNSSMSPTSGTRMTNQCSIMLIEEFGTDEQKKRKYTVENHLLTC
ncbi:uncharacterized protein [Oryza sativa Japonica Group]|uniref:uncharacterized protein n=1 Tax=Oryza sativa subsp. japonica TaxID=39947 RepID=UPI00077538E3|nr:uncharacterized protein LOC107279444 [Oryza sativa Japonica Group]KAF2910467.1 hypothetical protein DAI22_11g102100 [Oryza sativa Japonica Group]